jgi:hypothetical protein
MLMQSNAYIPPPPPPKFPFDRFKRIGLLGLVFGLARRVLFADWPKGGPDSFAGLAWTKAKITARLGRTGSLVWFGRLVSEIYEIDDPVFIGEAV